MGTLVAMHYPTKLALGAADHTYVRCGSGGKAWSCWGGKTGGAFLTSGSGSTNQADKIAEPNEKAGITCYLINGVCHQSANRILFPAGILVTGARGYGVSSAIFGPYGRPRGPFGTCSAPFNQHAGVTGDLPECATQPFEMVTPEIQRSSAEQEYFRVVSAAYGQARALGIMNEAFPDAMLMDFMPQLFNHQIDYKLGGKLKEKQRGRLTDIRVSAERSRIELENQFVRHEIPPTEFVARSDLEAISFQKNAASVLEPTEYETLFDLKYGEFVGAGRSGGRAQSVSPVGAIILVVAWSAAAGSTGNSMQSELEYGPRLSDAEYEKRILGLYRGLPPMPSPEQDRETRRQELNLTIDYRLGSSFPGERRAALWAAQQRIEKQRLRLGVKYLLRRFVAKLLARDAESLAGYAAEEYSKVLSPEELKRFLDLKEGQPPSLPVDVEHFQR